MRYKERRKRLLQRLKKGHPDVERGTIMLFANIETDKHLFRQESSFYYLTGINEPGAVFCLYWDGSEELFVPAYGRKREQWVAHTPEYDRSLTISPLGEACSGYMFAPFFDEKEYINLVERIRSKDGHIFALLDATNNSYFSSIYRFEKLFGLFGTSADDVVDMSPVVAHMRRRKDEHEIGLIEKAADITCQAHRVVGESIAVGMYEYDVQAEVERVFTKNRAGIAFPSIVATGKNTTILHYLTRDQKFGEGDLVVVDIGAEYQGYCADITRTYPVSKRFTVRQKEVHNAVLETQEHITRLAAPGMFLSNPDDPKHSLHHLAKSYLASLGLEQHFVHGIGHFLGLDVHDVGDVCIPLDVGDVFTIEPGVYIPDENIGVRIEDDFVITSDGCRCLSSDLVKKPEDIEAFR